MANINLSQSMQREADKKRKVGAADKGIYISLAVLVVILLVYGGLKAGTYWINSKKASVESRIAAESRGLEGKSVDEVADFQQRLSRIDSNLASQKNTNELLEQVGRAMVQGAVVSSLESASGELALQITADDFLAAAKQVLSFKKSDYFNNVQVSGISKDQNGKIILTLRMGV